MRDKVRAFIGIGLSEDALAEASRVTALLREDPVPVKWVRPRLMHVTVKFFGYIPYEQLDGLMEPVRRLAREEPAFFFELGTLGAFPSLSRPRVIWLGIGEGASRIEKIAMRIDENVPHQGPHARRQSYKAHITLARVKGRPGKAPRRFRDLISRTDVAPVRTRVRELVLFSSVLTADGPEYTPLERVPLS